MLIITSQVMLATLYHCMTVVPDCMPLSVSFKCLCCFYDSLHLFMCNCEDVIPAQEWKGDVFTISCCRQLGLRGWKKKQKCWTCSENVKFLLLRIVLLSKRKRPILCSSHKMFQKCSCQRKVTQTCSVNSSRPFAVCLFIFTWKNINLCVQLQCKGHDT